HWGDDRWTSRFRRPMRRNRHSQNRYRGKASSVLQECGGSRDGLADSGAAATTFGFHVTTVSGCARTLPQMAVSRQEGDWSTLLANQSKRWSSRVLLYWGK